MRSDGQDVVGGFRRSLAMRLVLAGLVWAALAGLGAYFIETERLEDTLLDQASREAHNLGRELGPRGGTAIDAALDALVESHADLSRDYFVLVEMYDSRRQALGESVVDGFEFVENQFDRSQHRFPGPGDVWYSKRGIDGTPFLQVMVPMGDGWFEGIYRISPQTMAALRQDIVQITALVVGAVLGTAAILYPLMAALHKSMLNKARDLLRANLDTLRVLGNAIAKRDSDTNAHNYRVTLYAVAIGQAMGMPPDAIRSLIKGAFLHDVGKIAIPDAILLKPGRLDEGEFEQMKTHVGHGLDIISGNSWLKDAADVVGGHHEKVDGSGYPAGLAGDRIPLAARIFAVADVFDALTSERPYKKPMPVERALAILEEGRGRHFDASVLDVFIGLMPELHAQIGELGEEVEGEAARVVYRYFQV